MRLTLRRGRSAPPDQQIDRSEEQSDSSHVSDRRAPPHTNLGRFRQQSLPVYIVTFSPRSIISFYFLVGILFIPLGCVVLVGSSRIRSIEPVSYANSQQCLSTRPSAAAAGAPPTNSCIISFQIPQTIPAPSYLYYSLTEYFQNARTYARSLSDVQIRGKVPKSYLEVENCSPLLYKDTELASSRQFNASNVRNPCGLTAWSRFNDTFQLCRDKACTDTVPLQKKGIAWKTDMKTKFHPGPQPIFSDETNALLQDEDFVVWMRLSAFSDFAKLYRIIQTDLTPGTYYMAINSNYPVDSFHGDKRFFISTTSWFGSRNYALGGSFIVVGALALLIGTILLIRFLRRPRIPVVQDPDRMLRQLAKLNLDYCETYQSGHA